MPHHAHTAVSAHIYSRIQQYEDTYIDLLVVEVGGSGRGIRHTA
jgi:hypothetical protein